MSMTGSTTTYPLGEPGPTLRPKSSRIRVAVGFIIGAGVIWLMLSGGGQVEQGVQIEGYEATMFSLAAVEGWELLVPGDGQPRLGFPEPMVWKSDGVCIGFSRVDFGPEDRRPTLARCVPHAPVAPLGANTIVSLVVIPSGFDTWHFVETAQPLESVRIELEEGGTVDADRIYIGGSTVALRLENENDLVSFEWSTMESTFQCTSDATAWRTSLFCTGP